MQCLAITEQNATGKRAKVPTRTTTPRPASASTLPGMDQKQAELDMLDEDGLEFALRKAYDALDAQYAALDAIARELDFDLQSEPSNGTDAKSTSDLDDE